MSKHNEIYLHPRKQFIIMVLPMAVIVDQNEL